LFTKKMAMVVLPFVSLCEEKVAHLSKLLEPLGRTCKGFYGSKGGALPGADVGAVVCTFEKANTLVPYRRP
jgi:DNA polymerase theta